jgi:hypothetical protein
MRGRWRRTNPHGDRSRADGHLRSRHGDPHSPAPTATVPSVGTIDVRVTDQANSEITAIVITANDLRVNQASGESDGTWLTIVEGEHTFDLLQVVGKEQSLGLSELAPGTYNQIRMNIQSVLITRDGVEIEGEVPSSVLRICGVGRQPALASTHREIARPQGRRNLRA